MRRVPVSVVLFVVASCGGKITCSANKNLNLEAGKEFISKYFEKRGGTPTSIECPGPVKGEKDGTFQCTVSFGTVKGTVNLIQTDDQGTAKITSLEGILLMGQAEEKMAGHFGKQLNAKVEVSCGEPRIRASRPGDKFLCDAKDAKGNAGKIEVTVDDTKANVTFKPVPTAP